MRAATARSLRQNVRCSAASSASLRPYRQKAVRAKSMFVMWFAQARPASGCPSVPVLTAPRITRAGALLLEKQWCEALMSWSLNIGKVAGTVVRIHLTFLLFLAWIFAASYAQAGAASAWDSLLYM